MEEEQKKHNGKRTPTQSNHLNQTIRPMVNRKPRDFGVKRKQKIESRAAAIVRITPTHRSSDMDFEDVVVSVTIGMVALAIQVFVLLVTEGRGMKAMARGEGLPPHHCGIEP